MSEKKTGRLTLTRRPGESIIIDGDIKVTVVRVLGNQVRIKIDCDREIWREELIKE